MSDPQTSFHPSIITNSLNNSRFLTKKMLLLLAFSDSTLAIFLSKTRSGTGLAGFFDLGSIDNYVFLRLYQKIGS